VKARLEQLALWLIWKLLPADIVTVFFFKATTEGDASELRLSIKPTIHYRPGVFPK
jgi:hypothetical protein